MQGIRGTCRLGVAECDEVDCCKGAVPAASKSNGRAPARLASKVVAIGAGMATPVIVAEQDLCTGRSCTAPWTLALPSLKIRIADWGPDGLKGGST
jgi:hypothetical protein